MKKRSIVLSAIAGMILLVPVAFLSADSHAGVTFDDLAHRVTALEMMVEKLEKKIAALEGGAVMDDHHTDGNDGDSDYTTGTRVDGEGTGNIIMCYRDSEGTKTVRVGVQAMWRLLADGSSVGTCGREFKRDHDGDHDDGDRYSDYGDGHDHTDHLEIEVEIKDGEAKVHFEHDGDKAEFTVDSEDQEDVIEVIRSKYDLAYDDVDAVIEFEYEDDDDYGDYDDHDE